MTENYKLNKLIVLCLAGMVALYMMLNAALQYMGKPLISENAIVLSVCSGLVGFMSRGVRGGGPAQPSNQINTDSVDTVVVQPQAEQGKASSP